MDNKEQQPSEAVEVKAEKKKNKGSNIGADATLLTFSKIATSAIAMVMAMLLSRFRTVDEYATYNKILMVVNLITSVLMLGLPKSLNFFLAKTDSQKEKKRFLSFYYTLNTILSFFVGLVLVISVDLIEKCVNNDMISSFLYFLALFPWTKIICASVENLLIVYKKAKMLVAYRVLNSAALLLAVLLVQWLGLGFRQYMLFYVIVEAAFSLAVYFIAAGVSGGIYPYISGKMLKTVLAFSIPLGLASVVGTLNIELDRIIISFFMDNESYGIYSNAAKELPVTLISSSFTAVLMPAMVRMLSKEENKRALKLWGNATSLSMIIIAVIGVGCFVYAEEVIKILYGTQYIEGVWVFRLYSLHLLMRCTYYGMVLNSIGKTGFIFWCSIGALASNAVLNVVLFIAFKPFGEAAQMVAPAIATLISTTAMAILQLMVTSKALKESFCDVFPWKQAAGILLLNIAFGAVFWAAKRFIPLETYMPSLNIDGFDGEVLESLVLGVVWGITYFALTFKTILKKWKALKVKD